MVGLKPQYPCNPEYCYTVFEVGEKMESFCSCLADHYRCYNGRRWFSILEEMAGMSALVFLLTENSIETYQLHFNTSTNPLKI